MAYIRGYNKDVVDYYILKDIKLKREEESLLKEGLVVYIYDTDASRSAIYL
jgi:hypothetical protein